MPQVVKIHDTAADIEAFFTAGSRTFVIRRKGMRTFSEAIPEGTQGRYWPTVTHAFSVHVAADVFSSTVSLDSLRNKVDFELLDDPDRSPDVLRSAMQYTVGAPLRAQYSPPDAAGKRWEGADWYDYLGMRFFERRPETALLGCLDCSGFVRMAFGFRHAYSLGWESGKKALPRTSANLAIGPGTEVAIHELIPGDLLFWDADTDGTIDHVGIYLGIDSEGKRRFVSSRKTPNGPTMGDTGGPSIIDGAGLYARTLVTARRL